MTTPPYAYSDWITLSDPAARLARLQLHIQEVTDKMDNERGSDGQNEGSSSLGQYLDRLLQKEESLGAAVNRGSPVSRVRLDRAS